jgi:hypothetical protein
MRFAGIRRPAEFRIITRAHVIAWRDDLVARRLGGKLPAITLETGNTWAAYVLNAAFSGLFQL